MTQDRADIPGETAPATFSPQEWRYRRRALALAAAGVGACAFWFGVLRHQPEFATHQTVAPIVLLFGTALFGLLGVYGRPLQGDEQTIRQGLREREGRVFTWVGTGLIAAWLYGS